MLFNKDYIKIKQKTKNNFEFPREQYQLLVSNLLPSGKINWALSPSPWRVNIYKPLSFYRWNIEGRSSVEWQCKWRKNVHSTFFRVSSFKSFTEPLIFHTLLERPAYHRYHTLNQGPIANEAFKQMNDTFEVILVWNLKLKLISKWLKLNQTRKFWY